MVRANSKRKSDDMKKFKSLLLIFFNNTKHEPTDTFNSSTSPNADTLLLLFNTLPPPIKEVIPLSPVLVYTLFIVIFGFLILITPN